MATGVDTTTNTTTHTPPGTGTPAAPHTGIDPAPDTGAYETLRDRLAEQAAELTRRAERLNTRRTEEFGASRLELAGTERLRTRNASVPADVTTVGQALLVGRNAVPAARSEAAVGDVLALYGPDLAPLPEDAVPGLLDDTAFVREFGALYRYYRDATLLSLRRVEGRILAVFRTGEKTDDVRVLRWACGDDGRVSFLDARGDRDHVLPPAHDFTWTGTTREDHVLGRSPHIAVPGGVFVATVGGTLTVGMDDGTETGEEMYGEPVDEPLQSLADADVAHARVGPLVLLRVRPYKEQSDRYLVCNTVTRTVVRLDGIGRACRRLPDEQGIVFPGGHCLATGAHRRYETGSEELEFDREVHSPNGEDVLYVFRDRRRGSSLLLSYNRIREEAAPPLTCRGWTLSDDGTLTLLRAGDGEPGRVHPVQLWSSPYVSDTHAAARPAGDGPLARIGNADLVRGISDCLSVARAATETTPTRGVYAELAAACSRAADAHHWLGDPAAGDLANPLERVRVTAEQVLAEFENVQSLTRQASGALDEAGERLAAVVRRLRGRAPRGAAEWVAGLTELRRARGHLLTLRDLRYADRARIDELDAGAGADLTAFGQRAVTHLAREDAFTSHHAEIDRLVAAAEAISTAAQAAPVAARLDDLGGQLGTVSEVVAGLDTGDATVRTAALKRVAEAVGGVNRARAVLDGRRRALRDREGRAGFAAEFALLGQAVAGALAMADSPEACDEQLARLLVRAENLESRFAEFDDVLGEIADKRDEIHEVLSARKQSLADARARRAERLADSAARVLRTVARRATELADADAVTAFFTSDPMPGKVRRTAADLRELGDPVRAEELDGRLDAALREALRALRDRADLYTDGGRTLRLGGHRFAVNTRPLDLTLVPDGGTLAFAVTGTDYRSRITDPDLASTRPYWDRLLPSESPEVYRGEHLAARLLDEHGPAALARTGDLAALVRDAAGQAYDEGYERGVHDHDATLILAALLRLHEAAGPLCHEPAARAAAQLFWAHGSTAEARADWRRRAVSLTRARDTFGLAPALADLRRELAVAVSGPDADAAAAYLLDELTGGPEGFVLAEGTRTLLDDFRRTVDVTAYDEDIAALSAPATRRQLVEAWLTAYTASNGTATTPGDLAEAVAAELCPDLPRYSRDAPTAETVRGLLGTHPRIDGGTLTLRVDELLARARAFRAHDVPGHRGYRRLRGTLVAAERARLRLDEHLPRVLPDFVRGRLLDEVYLPLLGDSLAKQLGTADPTHRTGTGGLLLLISPPGYGKTTLLEYVADRLGLMLVKVSGPALGQGVTSLDPAEAPNATARQEVEKINFALAAGNNTLLHLDDIQHASPELLQKFIPLCDATRRVDGVRDGEPHTYDLRGKRFAVCMAGNPYTESGSRFQVPDMLANRADVWNLGDVLTGREHAFALSFIENALTANSVLAPVAGATRADLDLLLRLAEGDPAAAPDRLALALAPAELEAVIRVLRHLLTVRETVLAVNAAYIASAAQSDATRTEPPFRLQGSYRNMRRIAQRVQPVMNDAELSALIEDHYRAEAQTLGTGAEANLLKLAELRGTLTGAQSERWAALKGAHVRARELGGPGHDQASRAVAALGLLADRIAAVESAICRVGGPSRGRVRGEMDH
ncbi:DNA repair ATPase [Streptomyces parvulus]|uniref:DNA repair ATPase n=1 Tax=Streptomyces parvulus TaxID=146923 RepID=UPI003690812B